MKKMFLAAVAMLSSAAVFAQVDSASNAATDTTTSGSTISADSTGMTTDSTATGGSMSDSTNAGSEQSSAATDTAGISEEDLRKYAVTMDSINDMKKTLLDSITQMVKGNASMKLSRYNELNKAMKDEAKLKELKATPEEVAFMKKVDDTKNEGAQEISDTFQSLAKDYIGVAKYNEIKQSLETDAELKARYEQIMSEVSGKEAASAR